MSDTNGFELVVATFGDETSGVEGVARLLAAVRTDRAAVPAAASIVKGHDGKLTIKETDDIGGKQGAAAGALAGGLVGLLSKKRGTVSSAALGALLGGVVAHKLDTGIPDPRLEAIGDSMDHSSSAAVAVLRDDVLAEAKALLSGMGAEIMIEHFDPKTDFVQQMQAGDYRGALSALANQAESMIANAGSAAGDVVKKVKGA